MFSRVDAQFDDPKFVSVNLLLCYEYVNARCNDGSGVSRRYTALYL